MQVIMHNRFCMTASQQLSQHWSHVETWSRHTQEVVLYIKIAIANIYSTRARTIKNETLDDENAKQTRRSSLPSNPQM